MISFESDNQNHMPKLFLHMPEIHDVPARYDFTIGDISKNGNDFFKNLLLERIKPQREILIPAI
ncbi:hypothetical protein [Undibacterium parvum]|uniref:Uncharacterized protein n=1 Tax=Undibacterium parvum TaxID=401471 RepID=A0A3Q9BRT0_9BURK|nr:hypothetical protein [Undibacterium parvum]AZP13017.1 hypothetical protein EJN92_14015 [Undibacterium parvum]